MFRSLTVVLAAVAVAMAPPAVAQEQAWVARSNEFTQDVMEMQAEFAPEGASASGLEQYDGLAMDLGPRLPERYVAAAEAEVAELRAALAAERDPNVRQDLEILIDSLQRDIEGTRLNQRLTLAWYDVPQAVFGNLNTLLDDQVEPARRAKAVELLRRYAGLHPDSTALTAQARGLFDESRGEGKVGPYKGDVEDALSKVDTYVEGIRALLEKYQLKGADEALDAIERQFANYAAWTRATVLPLAREDFRQPEELYAFQLKQYGIDVAPLELVARARRGFYETRQQMIALAPRVAAEKGLTETDYPAVIDALKRETIPTERLEAHYAGVLGQLEEAIDAHDIVSLPEEPVLMRLASEAENAASPAPHLLPARFIGNTGERSQFVLTTANPSAGDGATFNDFNFAAAAWTLSAHEGRPGHELQFATMIDRGVSLARMLYAFNSTNVEGWALYAEAEIAPYEPLEGQLIALQHRLLRASRAMLDPMLNLGLIDLAGAERVLRDEAQFSPAMVKQELDRYTFRAPGQAGSYYYGYSQLIDLRTETELALGDAFDRQAFNDFVIGQGLLPLSLLAKAVREEFVPAQAAD